MSRGRPAPGKPPARAPGWPSLVALVAAASLTAGCASTRPTPQDALRAYADQLADEHAEGASALVLGESADGPTERFEAEFRERTEQGPRYVERLTRAADEPAVVYAELAYGDDERLLLGWTDDGWRILDGVGGFYRQSTPREAIDAFANAIEQQDFERLLDLVPERYRALMTVEDLEAWYARRESELLETVALLRADRDIPIDEDVDSARVRYGAKTLRLVREGDDWKIEDFEVR